MTITIEKHNVRRATNPTDTELGGRGTPGPGGRSSVTDEAGSVWSLSLATSSGNLVPSSRPMQMSNQPTGGHRWR